MDQIILVLCILSCVISCTCCVFIALLYSRIKNMKQDVGKEDIGKLREDILNDLSRGRSEQNSLNAEQRREVAQSISKLEDKMNRLTQTNSEQIHQIYKGMFEKLNEMNEKSSHNMQKQNETLQASLEKIRESNEKKLEEMRVVVDEKLSTTLTERLDASFKTVSEQLTNLYTALGEMKEMSGGITENVSALNRVLTNVKARGTWAEVQLKNILDQTIPQMYVENYAPSEKSKDRVEFAIKIPSGENYSEITYLPLDSKFPIEDYTRLCDAAERGDAEAVARARKELEDRVLSEARAIRKYINVPKTTPFAIMYLATEGLYAEIVSSKNGIVEKIQNEYNIMIAGPTTITALLNSLSMGFRIAAINEKANEVRKILSAIKGQYEKFGDLLTKAKKKLDEAGKSLDDAKHRSDVIQKKLKTIESISTSESDSFLEMSEISSYEDIGDEE